MRTGETACGGVKIKERLDGVKCRREERGCQRCAAVESAFLFVSVESVFLVESVETEHVEGSGSNKLPVDKKICPDQNPPGPK